MAKLRASTIEPEGATTALTLGASGDAVTFSSDMIKANTFKDAGGNTLWTSNGSGTLSSVNSGLSGGGYTYISTTTVSSAVTAVEITTGIDSTYDEYLIIITDYSIATNSASLCMNLSINAGGSYSAVSRTSNGVNSYNNAGDATQGVAYASGWDLSNGTGDLFLIVELENNANSNACGLVNLYQHSNTTYMCQWESRMSSLNYNNRSQDWWTSGYCQSASAVDAVQFKCNNGNMTNGVFQLYGVS